MNADKLRLAEQQRADILIIEQNLLDGIIRLEPAACRAENEIEAVLKSKNELDSSRLDNALKQSESARSALRAAVIKALLETSRILTEDQRAQAMRP